MYIISTTSNEQFAQQIAKHLNAKLINRKISRFLNGETRIEEITESLRGKKVYVIFSVGNNINDEIMEASLLCWTIKQAHGHPHLVLPYYPYARQDKKKKGREPISAKWFADLLVKASAVETLITVDLHNTAIQGFPDIPMDNLTAGPMFAEFIFKNIIQKKKEEDKSLSKQDFVVISPDAGGLERAQNLANKLGIDVVTIWKQRDIPGVVSNMRLLGEVEGKICICIDDMADTCGTLKKAAEVIHENGAKEIHAFATHGVFSGNAIDNLNNSKLTNVYVTDTINLYDKQKQCPKIQVISITSLIASAILRHNNNASVSKIFNMDQEKIERELDTYRGRLLAPSDLSDSMESMESMGTTDLCKF